MSKPATIRFYLNGSSEPFFATHSSDGNLFSAALDLPEGEHVIQVTAQRVGESESEKSAPRTITVGMASAPVITSPADWSELPTATVTITVQASSGETVRVFSNGIQKAEVAANGSGVATATFPLDPSPLGIDALETITAHRVVGGTLSHASAPVRIIPTAGRVQARGAAMFRLMMTASLLAYNRYSFGGAWDREAIYSPMRHRNEYRNMMTSGEGPWNQMWEVSFLGGCAPGYMTAEWLRNHIDRINVDDTGKTSFHARFDGEPWPATPFNFDIAQLVVTAYRRGDRGVYPALKSKLLEVLANLPLDSNGLVRHGSSYSSDGGQGECVVTHGWPGTPVPHDPEWYWDKDEETNEKYNDGKQPVYYAETEGTIWYVAALRQLRQIAQAENDAATITVLDSYIASFQAAIATRVHSSGLIIWDAFPGLDECVTYKGTALAVLADAFPTQEQKDAALQALTASYVGRNQYPTVCGTLMAMGTGRTYLEESGGRPAYYRPITPAHMRAYAAAMSLSDTSLAQDLMEDMIRFQQIWYQQGRNWMGWNGAGQNSSTHYLAHPGWQFMFPISKYCSSWMAEKENVNRDIILTLNGSTGSEAVFDAAFGHRITAASIVASASCQATIEIIGNEAVNGAVYLPQATATINNVTPTKPWPPVYNYGPDQIMASITVNGTSASKTSGFKPAGTCSGGRVRVRVASVTAPPASFTVTLKQSRITPTLVADATLGFVDTFAADRLSEYTAIAGSKSTCAVLTRADSGLLSDGTPSDFAPFTRTMFKTTEAGWTALVQSASLFADGVVMIDKAMVLAPTWASPGVPSQLPNIAAYLRVSPDGQSYIKVSTGGTQAVIYDHAYLVEEVVNGVTVATTTVALPTALDPYYRGTNQAIAPLIDDNFNHRTANPLDAPDLLDESYLLVSLKGNTLKMAMWAGGMLLPWFWGYTPFTPSPFEWATCAVSHVTAAGCAGFGVYGPAEIDAVRICGYQDQPVPPGFILDTGGNVPKTEAILPQAYLTGEMVVPASDKCCFRNEWGAQMSPSVSGYNARWSY